MQFSNGKKAHKLCVHLYCLFTLYSKAFADKVSHKPLVNEYDVNIH